VLANQRKTQNPIKKLLSRNLFNVIAVVVVVVLCFSDMNGWALVKFGILLFGFQKQCINFNRIDTVTMRHYQ